MSKLILLPCPLCNNEDSFYVVNNTDIDHHIRKYGELYEGLTKSEWKVCRTCGFVFQNPSPLRDDLNRFYLDSAYHKSEIPEGWEKPENYLKFAQWYYQEKIDFALQRSGLTLGNVFEVGFGHGGVLKLFENLGWQVFGVEPDNTLFDFAKNKLELKSIHSGLLDVGTDIGTKVDLVFSNHTIEHIADLHAVMRGIQIILKPGGYVFTAAPTYYKNRSRLSLEWMNSAHYSMFTHNSLNHLFSYYGLEEVEHTYRGWHKEVDDFWHLGRFTGKEINPTKFYENPRKVRRYINIINPLRSAICYPVYANYAQRYQKVEAFKGHLSHRISRGAYNVKVLLKSPQAFISKAIIRIQRNVRSRREWLKNRLVWEVLEKRLVLRRLNDSLVLPQAPHDRGAILFFSPEAGVAPHFAAQCILARTLKALGHKVLFVRCFELFERCPVMDMYQLPYSLDRGIKTDTCLKCASNSFAMLDAYDLESIDLRSLLTDEVKTKFLRTLQTVPKDLSKFWYDSVPFGKLCINDLVLAMKISNFDKIDERTRLAWMKYIETSLLAYILVDQICQRFSVSRLAHFNDYSMMLGGRLAARKHNLPSYSVTLASHNNIDRRRYVLLANAWGAISSNLGRVWPAWRNLSLSPIQVKDIADDLLARLRASGSHTYSPAKTFQDQDVRSLLGLAKDRRLLVAYTSSLDEMVASRMMAEALGFHPQEARQPFADQIEWLHALTRFVETSSNLQLVVRVHPREGVNKRDSQTSQHLEKLKNAFDRPFQNCRFIWPQDPISSYDLGEAADLVLISWSTIGLELARLGAPVLASTNGISAFPQDDFMEWEGTPDEYFNKMEFLLDRPVTLETVIHAFRWYNLYHLGTSLDLGDVIPTSNFDGLPPFNMPKEANAIEEIIIKGRNTLDLNLERLVKSQVSESQLQETLALKEQLRRIIHFFYTGEDLSQDFRLLVFTSAVSPASFIRRINLTTLPPKLGVLLLNGEQTHYLKGNKTFSRFSPMCARLGKLCAQQDFPTPSFNPAISCDAGLIEIESQLKHAMQVP
jgi:SAM-dependent methyltransferase